MSKGHGINADELVYIGGLWTFICVFFVALFHFNLYVWVEKQNPLLQFGIVTIGLFMVVYGVLQPMSTVMGSGEKASGLSLGSILMFLAMDIPMPGYHVLYDGTLLRGDLLGMGSTDYTMGYIGTVIGLSGTWVFLWTYFLMFPLLLLLAGIMLNNITRC